MKLENLKHIPILFILALFILKCGNTKHESNQDKTGLEQDSSNQLAKLYNYSEIVKTHDSLQKIFSWPSMHYLDLNDDGINEEFLAVEGYSRGMDYALFCKDGNSWKLISGAETIASGHLGINKLTKINSGWHDFVALQPSGRDGIIESYYTWNGKQYTLNDQKEVQN